ncbi:MAG: PAS domain S-box protein, partial [Promethearchaeota archaeon]
MNDINNERKKIEERYKNLSVELETILNIIPGMVFCKDKNDVITRVNQTFAEHLKLNKEDIIGKTSFDLFPSEQAEKFRKDDLDVITNKKSKLNIEESADFPEGKIFSITSKVPHFDEKGEVIGTIGLAIDITDRKVMEQKLKESEEKYRSVIDALTRIGIGIDIVDLNFKILYQNKVLEDLFGQSEGKLCHKTYLGLDEQCDFCPMIKAVRNNKIESAIIPIPDGKIYEVISAPLPNLDGIIDRAAEVVIDITERKQAEIKLKKEREKAELYLNLVNVIIVALDRDGIITLINKKGCEILEYREEELIGQNWFETCLPPQDRNRVLTYFKKLMDGEIDVIESYENPIWTKHRNERLIAWSTVLFKDNSGKITGLLSSGEDITERKIAEEALLKEKKFTEKALNTQRDTFFVFEPSTGKAIRWNNAFSEITGYTDEEILSMKAPASYYSEEDLKKASESIAKIEKEGIATVEINLITKNGKSIPFEYIGSSITDEEGNLKYIVALGRDITERRKAEQDLKESENKYRQISERYEMLLESITDAVYVINRDWVYTLVNKMAEKIVHMPIENLLGNKITEVFPGIEHTSFFKTYDTVMNTRKPERVRDAFILPDGQTGYYEVSVYPINEGILCIGRNVTEEIKAEQKIKQEREKIELYLNLVSVIIVTLDRDGIITLINKKGCEILGYSKEALIGKNWFETCLPPQIRNRASKNFKKLMDGEIDELRSYENLIWTKYGDEKLIAWSTVILKDKSGNITGTLGSGEDITERKKAEIILKESEKKYKYLANELEMILDHIPGLVFFKDTENNFIRLNKYHADAHNLRKEDMEGVNCFDIYPKEQAQAYWEDDLEVIRTKKPKFNIIEPWDTPEGTRWALTSKIPYFDENGKITGIVGFAA